MASKKGRKCHRNHQWYSRAQNGVAHDDDAKAPKPQLLAFNRCHRRGTAENVDLAAVDAFLLVSQCWRHSRSLWERTTFRPACLALKQPGQR